MGQNYLKSYSPEFLFIKGGNNHAHNIEGYANMHLFESIFVFLGVVFVFMNIKKRQYILLLWWFIVAGVAPAITKDAPHSNRMFIVTPALSMIVALGMNYISVLMHSRWKLLLPIVVTAAYIGSLMLYADAYTVHFPLKEAQYWGSSYKQLSAFLNKSEYENKQVIMTSPESSPYIYLLFYGNYSPVKYQREAARYSLSRDGFRDVSGFGRFSFRPIDWGRDPFAPNTLLVSDIKEVPMELISNIKTTIFLPDGSAQFAVIEAPIPIVLKNELVFHTGYFW